MTTDPISTEVPVRKKADTMQKAFFADAVKAYNYARDALENQPDDTSAEQSELLSDAYSSAYERVITMRAADISDFRAKMEVLWEDPHSTPSATYLQSLMQDLIALTDAEPSRTFDAKLWLYHFERNGGGYIERDGELVLMVPHVVKDSTARDVLDDLMFSLEACQGRLAVIEAIKRRNGALAA